MGRRVRIEFFEEAGYPQLGTIQLWVNGEKIEEPAMSKIISRYAKKLC